MDELIALAYFASLAVPLIALASFWHFHIPYRFSLLGGIALLLSIPLAIAIGPEGAANFIAVLAYYFLSVGLVLAIAESRKERVTEDDSSREH